MIQNKFILHSKIKHRLSYFFHRRSTSFHVELDEGALSTPESINLFHIETGGREHHLYFFHSQTNTGADDKHSASRTSSLKGKIFFAKTQRNRIEFFLFHEKRNLKSNLSTFGEKIKKNEEKNGINSRRIFFFAKIERKNRAINIWQKEK